MKLGALGKQVGPLPLGVWLLVGGGGLFIAYRRSSTPKAPADPAATPADALPTGGGSGGGSGSPASWDGAPVVLSPVIQNAPPTFPVPDTAPVMVADPIIAPTPIGLPPAPPRVPSPVRSTPRPVAKAAPRPVAKPVAHKAPVWNKTYYRSGSSGSQVASIQRIVGASPDGKYGPKTAAAVRSYQARNGLVPDGVVGPQTWAKLYR